MSGGSWNYQQHRLEDLALDSSRAIKLLAKIEHELDWGICGDTCYECAKERVVAGLEAYFRSLIGDEHFEDALEILDDYDRNRCRRHAVRPSDIAEAVRGGNDDSPPEPSEPPPPLLSK